MLPTLLHSSDFCSWILVPSQTSPSDGERVKGTHSHEGGWEQELIHRQQSQRCQGTSLLAKVEEGPGGPAEDELLHHTRVAPAKGFSGRSLVPRTSLKMFLSWSLKDKGCVVS